MVKESGHHSFISLSRTDKNGRATGVSEDHFSSSHILGVISFLNICFGTKYIMYLERFRVADFFEGLREICGVLSNLERIPLGLIIS